MFEVPYKGTIRALKIYLTSLMASRDPVEGAK